MYSCCAMIVHPLWHSAQCTHLTEDSMSKCMYGVFICLSTWDLPYEFDCDSIKSHCMYAHFSYHIHIGSLICLPDLKSFSTKTRMQKQMIETSCRNCTLAKLFFPKIEAVHFNENGESSTKLKECNLRCSGDASFFPSGKPAKIYIYTYMLPQCLITSIFLSCFSPSSYSYSLFLHQIVHTHFRISSVS